MSSDSGLEVISIDYHGDSNYILRVADYDTGITIKEVRLAYKPCSVVLSPNNDFVAVATKGGTIICAAKTLKILRLLKTGDLRESKAPGNLVHIINVEDDKPEDTRAVAFTTDGNWLICGGSNSHLHLYRVYNVLAKKDEGRHNFLAPVFKLSDTNQDHQKRILSLCGVPNSCLVISSSFDAASIVWNVSEGRLDKKYTLKTESPISSISVINPNIVAMGGGNKISYYGIQSFSSESSKSDNMIELQPIASETFKNKVTAIAVSDSESGFVAVGVCDKLFITTVQSIKGKHHDTGLKNTSCDINSLCFAAGSTLDKSILVIGQKKQRIHAIEIKGPKFKSEILKGKMFGVHDNPDGIILFGEKII